MDPHLAAKYFIPSPSEKKTPPSCGSTFAILSPTKPPSFPCFNVDLDRYRYIYIYTWFHILLSHSSISITSGVWGFVHPHRPSGLVFRTQARIFVYDTDSDNFLEYQVVAASPRRRRALIVTVPSGVIQHGWLESPRTELSFCHRKTSLISLVHFPARHV